MSREESVESYEDAANVLGESWPEIAEIKENILSSFNTLKQTGRYNNLDDFNENLDTSLRSRFSGQKVGEIRESLYFALANPNPIYNIIDEEGFDSEIKDFISTIHNEYYYHFQHLYSREVSGRDYWKFINTKISLKDGHRVILDHEIKKGTGESFDITASVDSNITLLNHLLEETTTALEMYGDPSLNSIEEAKLERFFSLVGAFRESLEEQSEKE